MEKNIVAMGGSFNPPTLAHLKIIRAAMDAVSAEKGYLVPVSHAYLKRKLLETGDRICFPRELRLEMLKELCAADARLEISELELREIQSLTPVTMERFAERHPGTRCWFAAGMDKLHLVAKWSRNGDVPHRFGVILFARESGEDVLIREAQALCGDGLLVLPQPAGVEGISSTEVRRRFAEGENARNLLLPGVWRLLRKQNPGDYPREICRFREEYDFLHNAFPAKVRWEGLVFGSAEAAFQASKTSDLAIRRQFADCGPVAACRKGAMLRQDQAWEKRKLGIMEQILRAKFTQNPELKQKLMQTRGMRLINGHHGGDLFWGVDLYAWQGENRLGVLLMGLRNEFEEDGEKI